MRRLRYSWVPVFVLVVAACGGGSSSSKSSSTTTPPTVNKAADLELAKGSVLTASDAPAGFSAKAHQESSDPPEPLKRDFANCVGTPVTIFDSNGQKANGPDFANENGDEISNSVEVDATKADVDKGYAALTSPKINDCLAKLFAALLKDSSTSGGAGMTVGEVTVDSFPVDGVGDRGVGFRVTVPITANGQSVTVYVDVASVQRGRSVLTVTASGNGTPPSRDLEKQLLTKMSERMGATAP